MSLRLILRKPGTSPTKRLAGATRHMLNCSFCIRMSRRLSSVEGKVLLLPRSKLDIVSHAYWLLAHLSSKHLEEQACNLKGKNESLTENIGGSPLG